MQLIKYEAARTALIAAKSIDEVKNIKDKSEAMRAYAKQSKDYDMANWAAEIRIRAERRMGEMIKVNKELGLMNKGAMGKPGNEHSLVCSHDDSAPKLSDMGITHSMSSRAQAIASVPEEEFEQVIAEHKESEKELTSSTMRKLTDKALVTKHTGDEESYTPLIYIESARKVMDGIDLDPASNDMAQKNVLAKKYYTVDDDGLIHKWSGKVWINPPYTALVINKFIGKLVSHYINGDITEAVLLTNNNTDTSWFHHAADSAAAVCFTRGRINFLKRDGSKSSPTNGQSFFYFGSNADRFVSEFSEHGLVMVKS